MAAAERDDGDKAHLGGVVASFVQYSLFVNGEADRRQRHLDRLDGRARSIL